MVSYKIMINFNNFKSNVLILVVVDDGLVLIMDTSKTHRAFVLILVVVDDGLVHKELVFDCTK